MGFHFQKSYSNRLVRDFGVKKVFVSTNFLTRIHFSMTDLLPRLFKRWIALSIG